MTDEHTSHTQTGALHLDPGRHPAGRGILEGYNARKLDTDRPSSADSDFQHRMQGASYTEYTMECFLQTSPQSQIKHWTYDCLISNHITDGRCTLDWLPGGFWHEHCGILKRLQPFCKYAEG